MMLTSILISFSPEYYKEFVAKNNSQRSNLGSLGASVLSISTTEACDDI